MAKQTLGRKDVQLAEHTKRYLIHDYKPLFEGLLEYYQNKKGSEEYKLVQEAVGLTKSAIDLFSHVFLEYGLTAESLDELDLLNSHLERIEELKNYFLNIAIVPETKMQEALDAASRMTGVDPARMKMVQQLSRRAKKNYRRRQKGTQRMGSGGILSQVLGAFGISPRMAATFMGASQILGPLLGPFYPTLPLVYGAGVVGFKGIRSMYRAGRWGVGKLLGVGRRTRHPQGRTRSVTSPYAGIPDFGLGDEPIRAQRKPQPEPATPGTPEFGNRIATDRGYIGDPNIRWRNSRTGRFVTAGAAVGKPITESVSWGKPRKRLAPMNKRELHYAALPMFYFFNKLAYKARWTRDVLRALKKSGGGILGGKAGRQKLSLLELFGAGAIFKTLGKAALVLATKLIAFAVVIGFATKVFTDLYKLTQKLKQAKTAEHEARTKAAVRARPAYGRMRSQSYQRIYYMDVSEQEKAKLRAEVDKRLRMMQLKEELERIESMPRIWVGPDRNKQAEAKRDFWKKHFPGVKGFLKSYPFTMRKEEYFEGKWREFEAQLEKAPKVPGAPTEFLHRRPSDKTVERLKEQIQPIIQGPQQDAATIALQAMLKKLGIEDSGVGIFSTKNMEESLKEIAGHQKRLLDLRGASGGDDMSGPYNSSCPLVDSTNKDGADSIADR